jgi:hypothetical protein
VPQELWCAMRRAPSPGGRFPARTSTDPSKMRRHSMVFPNALVLLVSWLLRSEFILMVMNLSQLENHDDSCVGPDILRIFLIKFAND